MGGDSFELALLAGALVLLVAIAAVRLTSRIGLPSLLAYIAIGLIIGDGGHLFNNASVTRTVGLTALALILAEGGLTTEWRTLRRALPHATVLATAGVGISLVVTGLITKLVLDCDWRVAFLVGAIVSSTDAAAVFSILRTVSLPRRLAGLLESESGLNDAPVVIAVMMLTEADTSANGFVIAGTVVYMLIAGAIIGFVIARLGTYGLRRIALPASGLYPIAVLTLAVTAYAAGVAAGASGFIAVYVAGLVLGNSRLPHGPANRAFAEGVAWLSQIGLFVMLGLLAVPTRLPGAILPALGVGFGLLLVARPISVALCMVWFRMPWREQAFLSWAGLRGAVPIVLATVPLTAGISGSEHIFDIVFVLVVVFTLVEGPTLPWVAKRLGVSADVVVRDLELEVAPLERLSADMLQLSVPEGSKLAGVEIFELRLPRDAAVTLIVREGRGFVPDRDTPLQAGDDLLVVTTARSRAVTEERLRAVSRRGRLAAWYRDATP